jgi:hypothetical protein
MNQELPKPARNALARQTGGEVHPSPDALTSFVERTLPRDERELVVSHLAACADCRGVVFLASSAAEDAVVSEELVAAAAAPQLVPTQIYGSAHLQPAILSEIPKRRWALGLSWGAAAMVALLVCGVVIWQRFNSGDLAARRVSNIASNRPQPDAVQLAPSVTPSAQETPGITATAKTASPRVPNAVGADALARKEGEKYQLEPRMAASAADESAQAPARVEGSPAAAPPARQTGSVEAGATALQLRPSQALAKSMTSTRSLNAAHGQWRISGDGHLERRVAAEDWARELADQSTTFHVVSVVGADVWAGGSSGALFHSGDGGQHWSQVPLANASGAESGTIVSIQFNDAQQGTVITGSGSQWSTSDGGVTWTSR